MPFVRKKKRGDRTYFYLVETVRGDDGKPRQKVLRYYGCKPPRGRQRGLRPVQKVVEAGPASRSIRLKRL